MKKFLYAGWFYALLLVVSAKVYAQPKDGIDLYRQHKYTLAQQRLEQWYKAGAKTDSSNSTSGIMATAMLADCYWINRDYKNAFAVYNKLKSSINAVKSREILKRMADIQAMNGNYDSAALVLNGIKQFNEKRKGFETYTTFLKDSGNWELSYLDMNTLASELSPAVYNSTFFLAADREPTSDNYRSNGNFSRIQYFQGTPKTTGNLDYVRKHGSLDNFNTVNVLLYNKRLAIMHENADAPLLKQYSVGKNTIAYDNHGQPLGVLDIQPKFLLNAGELSVHDADGVIPGNGVAYFLANDDSKQAMKNYAKFDTAQVPVCIYRGVLSQDNNAYAIKNATKMSIEGFEGQLLHASVSSDGKILVFSGKLFPESTDFNLYYAKRTSENKWGGVTELGKNINTAGNEVFPDLQDDGTLFFSSDGLPGLGALDVFYLPAFYVDEVLSTNGTPINLGYPFNTPFDDYGVVVTHLPDDSTYKNLSSMAGYLTSNRAGTDDIFYFNYQKKIFNYKGSVYGKMLNGSKLLDGATVKLYTDGNEIGDALTDKNGGYSFNVDANHSYTLKAEKEGWVPSSIDVTSIQPIDGTFPNIFLDSIVKPEQDTALIGENEVVVQAWMLHHEFDKTNIIAKDANVLAEVAGYYQSHPGATVKIFSTADCYGTVKHNTTLAKNRSTFIRNNLLSKGVSRIVEVSSAAIGKRMIPCPDVYNNANKVTQVANRYTTIFITIKKQ